MGARLRSRVRLLPWLLLGLTAALGCDREGRVRAEARTFLALYEATDHRASLPERERKIVQPEQLTLSDEAVRRARDECVGAHRALVEAERANEHAAGQLDRAIAAQPEGGPLAASDTVTIRAGI